jgi:hypothetical protein
MKEERKKAPKVNHIPILGEVVDPQAKPERKESQNTTQKITRWPTPLSLYKTVDNPVPAHPILTPGMLGIAMRPLPCIITTRCGFPVSLKHFVIIVTKRVPDFSDLQSISLTNEAQLKHQAASGARWLMGKYCSGVFPRSILGVQ